MNLKKRILFVSMKYEYGNPERGLSYDYVNLFRSLELEGCQVELFDFMERMQVVGRDQLNHELLEKAKVNNYDIIFISFYTDQLKLEVVRELQNYSKTVGIFYDDTWRREYTARWGGVLSYFTTRDIFGEVIYRDFGLKNAIFFGYSYSSEIYQKRNLDTKYDVSFVGSSNPARKWVIHHLEKVGIKVHTFGFGWPNGVISFEEMVNVFNQSKINLNLSNSITYDVRYLFSSPRAFLNFFRSSKKGEQLKGRHVEINACGGFQLTFYADGLESHYEPNKEIAVYQSVDDMAEKIQFFLRHEEVRRQIADQGYQKTIAKLNYSNRIQELFERIGV